MKQEKRVVRSLTSIVLALSSLVVADVAMAEDKMDSRVEAAINERIAPVGQVRTGKITAAATSGKVDAKGTYQSACFACHGTGAAGAPKLGDKGAWKKRIAQGKSTLYSHALKGFKGMPPKGGRSDLSDAVVKAVVDYMVSQGK